MLPVARKDVLPITQKSSVIYEYKCHCDSRYVERTSQWLQDRIKQYVPQWLRQQLTSTRRSQPYRLCKRNDTKPDCDSATGQHHLENDQCALNYVGKRFSILATARCSFHLNLLNGCLYQDPAPGFTQTERVCLRSQTLAIIAAFGLLLRFTILALSLAGPDCPTSKLTT